MNWFLNFVCSSIGKKVVMALTGFLLGLFLLVHLLGNSTAFLGRASFEAYAHHLHSLGPFIPLFEACLLSTFLLHILLAGQMLVENFKARPSRYYLKKDAGGRTLGSKTMPYTGGIILVFIIIHLLDFHFTSHSRPISEIVRSSLVQLPTAFFYLISLLALTAHTSHGFWSIFQSMGLNHHKYNDLIKKVTIFVSLASGLIFILIPVAALIHPGFLK